MFKLSLSLSIKLSNLPPTGAVASSNIPVPGPLLINPRTVPNCLECPPWRPRVLLTMTRLVGHDSWQVLFNCWTVRTLRRDIKSQSDLLRLKNLRRLDPYRLPSPVGGRTVTPCWLPPSKRPTIVFVAIAPFRLMELVSTIAFTSPSPPTSTFVPCPRHEHNMLLLLLLLLSLLLNDGVTLLGNRCTNVPTHVLHGLQAPPFIGESSKTLRKLFAYLRILGRPYTTLNYDRRLHRRFLAGVGRTMTFLRLLRQPSLVPLLAATLDNFSLAKPEDLTTLTVFVALQELNIHLPVRTNGPW